MATYQQLAREYRREAVFGTSLNFFSSFGQTFFIALVLPGMAAAAGASMAQAGSFYAAATLLSAALLACIGRLTDLLAPRTYAVGCAMVLLLACLAGSRVDSIPGLVLALILVRWAGQGLLPHASSVALAKRFPDQPGPAFAIASLGFPIGEAILPAVVAALLAWTTFQNIFLSAALAIAVILLPILFRCGTRFALPPHAGNKETETFRKPGQALQRVWRDARLWMLLPILSAQGFAMTGLLFYQSAVGPERGWDLWWWASGLALFAVMRAVAALGVGHLLSTRRAVDLLGWTLLPLLVGCGILLVPGLPGWGLLAFFLLAGVSMGTGPVAGKTAMVEVYPTHLIGRAKAAANAIGVLSTAAAPALYGYLADFEALGWSQVVLWGNLLVALGAVAALFLVRPKLCRYSRSPS